MKERLLHFLKAENLSSSDLAEAIGVQPSTISHILSGRNRPGFEFIENFLLTYPHVNAAWFITGKGDMYTAQAVPDRPSEPVAVTGTGLFDTETPKKPVQVEVPLPKTTQAVPEKLILLYSDQRFEEYILRKPEKT